MTRLQIAFAVLCFLAALSLVMMAPAFAQGATQCGRHDKITEVLQAKFNETRRTIATTTVAGGTNFVEVFASKKGTWTLLVSTPQGLTCIFASGDDYEDLPIEIEGKDS